MEKYIRNRIYVTPHEQEVIKQCRIILGGAGIGSIIAECALRLGFENMTIIDGDRVEESNLNRQNYLASDIGDYKVQALKKRLLKINPSANITIKNKYINQNNVEELITNKDIAINALDYKSEIPFLFDEYCQRDGIPVIHPFNIGWGGLVFVVTPDSNRFSDFSSNPDNFEINLVEYIINQFSPPGVSKSWLREIINSLKDENTTHSLPPPQLSIGSWMVAGMVTNIMFEIAINKEVRCFPEFYISTIKDNVF